MRLQLGLYLESVEDREGGLISAPDASRLIQQCGQQDSIVMVLPLLVLFRMRLAVFAPTLLLPGLLRVPARRRRVALLAPLWRRRRRRRRRSRCTSAALATAFTVAQLVGRLPRTANPTRTRQTAAATTGTARSPRAPAPATRRSATITSSTRFTAATSTLRAAITRLRAAGTATPSTRRRPSRSASFSAPSRATSVLPLRLDLALRGRVLIT